MGEDAVEFGENVVKATAELAKMFEKMVPDYENNMDKLVKVLNEKFQKTDPPFSNAMVWPKGMNADLMNYMTNIIMDGLFR